MDIKWKNKNIYRIGLIILIYLLSFSVILASDIFNNREYFNSNAYFESKQFKNNLKYYLKDIELLYTEYKDFDKKSDEEKVSKEDIAAVIQKEEQTIVNNQNDILNQYSSLISQAIYGNDFSKASSLWEEEKQKFDEACNKKLDINEIKKSVLADKIKNYENIKKSINSNEYYSIKYYLKDNNDGKTYSNLTNITGIEAYIKKHALYSLKLPNNTNNYEIFPWIGASLSANHINGYLIVTKQEANIDQIQQDYLYYISIRDRLIKETIIFLFITPAVITILFILMRKNKLKNRIIQKLHDIILILPLESELCLIFILMLVLYKYLKNVNFFYKPIDINHFIILNIVLVLVLFLVLMFYDVIKIIIDKSMGKCQPDRCVIRTFSSDIRQCLKLKGIMVKICITAISILITGVLVLLEFIYIEQPIKPFIVANLFMIIILLCGLFYIINKTAYIAKIIDETNDVAAGNINCTLEIKGNNNLSRLACNINNLNSSFKNAMESKIKSERLKSELITNVSHDLRTPLTSIINFINLLKKDNLSETERSEYLSILDRKTQRLKVLIDDLFEAAKMSSGDVELNLEKLDVEQLLQQALGELDSKIKASALDFRVNIKKHNTYACLDGKKTWRAFENLIDNAIKYSLPNTRVYIELDEAESCITIAIKNVSAYELDFDADEIFERFKRGDKARNTEGSGLGLAIVKSIVELQNGQLLIETDGDLFKAILIFKSIKA